MTAHEKVNIDYDVEEKKKTLNTCTLFYDCNCCVFNFISKYIYMMSNKINDQALLLPALIKSLSNFRVVVYELINLN